MAMNETTTGTESTGPHSESGSETVRGIVSVNARSGGANRTARLMVLLVIVGIVAVLGAVMALNKWKANRKAEAAKEEQASKVENKSAQVGMKRVFDTDPVVNGKAGSVPGGAHPASLERGVIVPGVELGADEIGRPIPLAQGGGAGRGGTGQPINPPPSRFGGDAILTSTNAGSSLRTQHTPASETEAAMSMVRDLLGGVRQADAAEPGPMGNAGASAIPASMAMGGADTPASAPPSPAAAPVTAGYGGFPPLPSGGLTAPPGPPPSGAGPIGGLLTPSNTPKIQAGMLGDRNMILPKGRSIDCALTVRVINEVAGMATCVLNADVYSDNGRVVLLERGSEAVGEYSATMAQGQRRLFLLWTRVKTPNGVVINLNSPGADELGTSGLSGYVDNHWWDRLGAAFLLSIVQDAIGYATAQAAGGGGQGQLSIYQNSATTGNRMAELVLQSTINIKPTLYKNQGDRGTIFVARDLDFGLVYALQPD